MQTFTVAVLPGDGIGPEVMDAAVRVIKEAADRFGFDLDVREGLVGQKAVQERNNALPLETIQLCRKADGVLLGPIAGPKLSVSDHPTNPRRAVMELRGWLGVYANFRPIRVYESLLGSSSLKPETISGVDLMIVRDVSAGLFYGTPRGIEVRDGRRIATNTMAYTDTEIERVARHAFDAARRRRKHLVLATWGKLLETGALWEDVTGTVAKDYPDVAYEVMDLDTCTFELVDDPRQFDVILADISAGDLLSVQASALSGTTALHPSAVLDGNYGGLFSPSHGTAPDLVGKGIANPTASFLAGSMLLDHALCQPEAAMAVRDAVDRALTKGARTCDVCPAGVKSLPTDEFTERVLAELPPKLSVPPIKVEREPTP